MKKYLLLLLSVFITHVSVAQAIEELSELYKNKNYSQLDRRCLALLMTDPNNPVVNLAYGRSLADQGKSNDAIVYLKKSIQSENEKWVNAWAYAYLGTSYFIADDPTAAKMYLDSCVELTATKNVTDFARKKRIYYGFNKEFDNWAVLETENIRFHFKNYDVVTDPQEYIDKRQKAFEEINKYFNATLPKKIDFFVWNTNEEAKQVLKKDIGFSLFEECIVHSWYNQTLGHEITHVISHHALLSTEKTKLINEGVAVHFDLTERDYMEVAGRKVKEKGERISIKDLWQNGDEEDEGIIYTVGGAWVGFLQAKLSKEELWQVLTHQTYKDAKQLLGKKLGELIDDFEKQVNDK